MSAELESLTWPEVEAAPPALLAIPLGATEQHGPHLGFGTDTAIAVALARRAAARLPGTLVAPALPFGSSGEHDDFPGTLSIGREATELTLLELGRSAARTSAHTVFVSAHGGNAEPLRGAVGRLREEGRDVRAWEPRWDGDAHAGRTETSLMLALAPSRVRPEAARPGNIDPLAELIGELAAHGVRELSGNGVLGDPTGASAAEGEALLDLAAGQLVEAARAWFGFARTPAGLS